MSKSRDPSGTFLRQKPSTGEASNSNPATAEWQNSVGSGANRPLAPALYLVATPIGNARDITLRALDVLRACDVVAAEDTRVTSRLFAIHGISRPLVPYNDHNAAEARPRLIARLKRGERVALVSDAGTPLVSDPGFKLVREAIAAGIGVEAIPGSSAVLAALTVSGLPTNRFLFAGFLPPKGGERRTALTKLKTLEATLIFFEAPQRLAESLADMLTVLGPRPAMVGRELTKLHEEHRHGDIASLAEAYAKEHQPKGEIAIVIGPPLEAATDYSKADKALEGALEFMPVRAAADLVAEVLDLPRGALYKRALAIKTDR